MLLIHKEFSLPVDHAFILVVQYLDEVFVLVKLTLYLSLVEFRSTKWLFKHEYQEAELVYVDPASGVLVEYRPKVC